MPQIIISSTRTPRIEMLSGARALNGDHIYTLASVNANAAVIKGVLKQGKPEQLTATWSAVRIGTALFHVLHTFSEIGLERLCT